MSNVGGSVTVRFLEESRIRCSFAQEVDDLSYKLVKMICATVCMDINRFTDAHSTYLTQPLRMIMMMIMIMMQARGESPL